MKKFFVIMCGCVFLLAGCIKSDTTIYFNEDKTIDMNIVYSIARNAGAADEAIESILESVGAQLDEAEITYEKGKDEAAYSLTVPLRFDTAEEMISSKYFDTLALIPRFTSGDEEGRLHIALEDGNLEIGGVMNASSLGFDSFITQAGIEPDNMQARLALVLPDGTSEEWSVKGSEEAEVSFAAENIYGEESKSYSSYASLAIAAVIVIAAAIVIVPKKKKKED